MSNRRVFLASDHAGFKTKEFIKEKLIEEGYGAVDCGAYSYEPDDDYPDFVARAADALLQEPGARAIILGGSGQGEAIEANRRNGVRAAVYYGGPVEIITLSREHNDANTLALGARFLTKEAAWEAAKLWLETQFSEAPRHTRRIGKLDN